jgi:hypothetical protein
VEIAKNAKIRAFTQRITEIIRSSPSVLKQKNAKLHPESFEAYRKNWKVKLTDFEGQEKDEVGRVAEENKKTGEETWNEKALPQSPLICLFLSFLYLQD